MDQEHIIRPTFQITKKERRELHGHKSCILWFTGLSGSGKSTIANGVEQRLHEMGYSTYILDGDNLRWGLNRDLTFSPEDRTENIRRVGEVSKLFVDGGIVVLATFIAPYAKDREMVRELVEDEEFIEVYVKCSLEACEHRDPKGLYKKARSGEIKEFTGISAPYEIPEVPDLIIETENKTVAESVSKVIHFLKERSL